MESTERLKAVRSHALTRYREHYPDAEKEDVLQAASVRARDLDTSGSHTCWSAHGLPWV